MGQVWVVIDGNYLCHRAYHAFPELSYEDVRTGVVYGFLQDILQLRDRNQTDRFVFAFDHGKGIREYRYPFYKESRRLRKVDQTDEEEERLSDLSEQITKMKTEYLSDLGYHNVFFRDGYEADDIIASVIKQLPPDDEAIVVSADKDLYQCLSDEVSVYAPRTKFWHNLKWFWKQYQIDPCEWVDVKAIAGCSSDDVPGVDGVGDYTACAYLRGDKLNKGIKERIEEFKKTKQYKQNLDIVRIPYRGCPNYQLAVDSVSPEQWKKLTKRLGIRKLPELSLRG
jgi:DNA polymerase I